MEAADQPAAETLLDAFKTISASERRKHASVLNYWLSIRGDKEFPPLHDLDPLEISDAGGNSILLELISGGHDAEIRHLGDALRFEGKVERIIDAPSPSMLACVAKKLPIVAISRDFLAFEDEYDGPDGTVRVSATLLPLSAGGAWVDYVYALVTVDGETAKSAKSAKKPKADEPDPVQDAVAVEEHPAADVEVVEEPAATVEDPVAEEVIEGAATEDGLVADPVGEIPEPVEGAVESVGEPEPSEPLAAPEAPASIDDFAEESLDLDEPAKPKPGFSKLFDNLVGLTGFYGHGYKVDEGDVSAHIEEPPAEEPTAEEPIAEAPPAEQEPAPVEDVHEEPIAEAIEPADAPVVEEVAEAANEAIDVGQNAEPAAEEAPVSETADQPAPVSLEGPLKNKLSDVRAKADEARQAKLRANAALYDGLSAAYDFALDAEEAPEEYLRLVEAEGLKIQLRSPMRPVVKLAFNGLCDEGTIKQLEAVLAWALDNELPRGSLAEQIEAAGGIGPILSGETKAAA
jgi:hypothetical protein